MATTFAISVNCRASNPGVDLMNGVRDKCLFDERPADLIVIDCSIGYRLYRGFTKYLVYKPWFYQNTCLFTLHDVSIRVMPIGIHWKKIILWERLYTNEYSSHNTYFGPCTKSPPHNVTDGTHSAWRWTCVYSRWPSGLKVISYNG